MPRSNMESLERDGRNLDERGEINLGGDPSVYVLLYMLDCATAVACVVMGLEATEDRKAAVREGGGGSVANVEVLPVPMLPISNWGQWGPF